MSAAEHLREAIDVGCTRDDHDHVGDHRAEVLAEAGWVPCSPKWLTTHPGECPTAPRVPGDDNTSHWHPNFTHSGAYRRIAEALDYLATKDAVQLSEDAGAMGFHIVAILDGPGPIEDPATRPALPWAAFLEDVEVSGLVEELASVFLDYWRGERAADASTLAEVERLLATHRDGSQAAEAARKDTGAAVQAPAGESTQSAPDTDDEAMSAVRAAVADFPYALYGIDIDGPDPAWVGDLASAITGALPAAGDEQPAPDFFQPGHGYTHRDGTDFLCVTVTTHPASGERLAIGWLADLTGLHFLVHRHIGHWLHEYDGCRPPEDDDTAYAATRGEPGDGA